SLPTWVPAIRIFSRNAWPFRTSFNSVIMFMTRSLSLQIVERDVEGVEVAPSPAVGKRRCGTGRDQRHLLLGDSAMRARVRIVSREIVRIVARPDDGESLGDDDKVADTVGRQLETRTGQRPRQHEGEPRNRGTRGAGC